MTTHVKIHPDNPEPRFLSRCYDALLAGKIIALPTDTGFSMGCLLSNKQGQKRIALIRALSKQHNFTLLCKDLSHIAQYARVSNTNFRLLKRYTPGPYTFILPATHFFPKHLLKKNRKTIGIRVPDNTILLGLLAILPEPIISVSLLKQDDEVFSYGELLNVIDPRIDLFVDSGVFLREKTTVLDLTDDSAPALIREGLGHFE